MESKILQIVDPEIQLFAQSAVKRFCDGPHMLRADIIHEKQWQLAPIETGLHIDDALAEKLIGIASLSKITTIYAIETEGLNVPFGFEVPLTREGFDQFNYQCAGFNYLLVPRSEAFALLCSTDDYLLFAAPENLMKIGFPEGLEKMIAAFVETYASDKELWGPTGIANFERVVEYCRKAEKTGQV